MPAAKSSYRTFVIMNPRSSGGATSRRWATLAEAISSAVGTVEHAATTAPGDAIRLAREAVEAGFEMIVAVGGDGTVNEVVNGFLAVDPAKRDPERLPVLGLIPSGTGGDYRKTWGVDDDPIRATERLRGLDARTADAGRVTWTEGGVERSRHFANIASFGLGGEVSARVNASSKRLGGRASFFLASAGALMSWRNRRVKLVTDLDHPHEGLITFGALAIGRVFGGGMRIAPDADPGDGMFDIVTVERMTKLDLLRFTSVYSGRHLTDPKVSLWHGASVTAELLDADPTPCRIEADGEVFGQLPARFDIVPSAFRVKV